MTNTFTPDHGHERIAFVGDVRHFYTARRRLEGYEEALEAARLQPLQALDAHTIRQGEEAATRRASDGVSRMWASALREGQRHG